MSMKGGNGLYIIKGFWGKINRVLDVVTRVNTIRYAQS
jgi:hypothetical protein